jgi:glycosyltransferase involved in cell wall biosynthesis
LEVVVDGRYFCSMHRSLALFTGTLLRALTELDLGAKPVVLLPGDIHPIATSIHDDLGDAVTWIRAGREVGHVGELLPELRWVHREIPRLLAESVPRAKVLLMPYHHPPWRARGVRRVVFLHDLCGLGIGFPKYKKNFWRHYLRLRAAAHMADRIWPISESTRKEMAGRFPASRRRMGPTVYNAVDREAQSAENVHLVLEKYGLERHSYVVGFATWDRRKNFPATLKALSQLHQAGRAVRLVGIAPESDRQSILRKCSEYGLTDTVILCDIADGELDALYAGALALVWPSTCEGFGYPVVEAMAQGCPPLVWEVGPGAELVRGAVAPLSSLSPTAIASRLDGLRAQGQHDRARLQETLVRRASDFSLDTYSNQLRLALADLEAR